MPKITRVDVLDDKTLDIELDNGTLVLFNAALMIESDDAYRTLRGSRSLAKPKTDGDSIFWDGCPKLALKRILEYIGQ